MTSRHVKYVPNFLTILRFLLAPLCIYLLIYEWRYVALFVFVLASITDFLDGFFARRYDAVSKVGSFLDPLADKFLVVGMFASFFYLNEIVDIYILSMVVFRDVFVTLLRLMMQANGKTMITSKLSKMKTTVQIVVIILLFLNQPSFLLDETALYYLALSMSFLTLYTGFHYLFYNFRKLKTLLVYEP
tara:strand:+ start:137 stop:700 length:564 start_codon:yes stop_codon:yes gene_type:complete